MISIRTPEIQSWAGLIFLLQIQNLVTVIMYMDSQNAVTLEEVKLLNDSYSIYAPQHLNLENNCILKTKTLK